VSGGQKPRVASASVMYNSPQHVLILDEPKNHLDSDSLESLANTCCKKNSRRNLQKKYGQYNLK
jgi:ABC-type protease/lipase transport system fused ATPase/permease subunit